jgi:hypothetical protein
VLLPTGGESFLLVFDKVGMFSSNPIFHADRKQSSLQNIYISSQNFSTLFIDFFPYFILLGVFLPMIW